MPTRPVRGGERASRRGFLTSAGGFGMLLALSSLTSGEASGLPVLLIEGSASGDERRYPIPAADSVNVGSCRAVDRRAVAGPRFVFALSCPHQNNAVKWLRRIIGSSARSTTRSTTGRRVHGRPFDPQPRHVIRHENDSVVVDLHRSNQFDKDPAAWAAATLAV